MEADQAGRPCGSPLTEELGRLVERLLAYSDIRRNDPRESREALRDLVTAELLEVQRDALRYRWLRTGEHRYSEHDVFDDLGRHLLEMQALDARIDAAMREPA